MLNRLPEFINPLHFVDRRRGLKGTIAIDKMKRLASLLIESTGNAELEIQFDRDSAGLAIATGSVSAKLLLPCQRCLQPMEIEVDSQFTLGVVTSLSEARNLPENYEPLIVELDNLPLADLVEDEILLALPAIAMHSEQCLVSESTAWQTDAGDSVVSQQQAADSMYNTITIDQSTADDEEGKPHPFAVLAELKEKINK
ncbi:YceD family protein [Kaarinaea lacus]